MKKIIVVLSIVYLTGCSTIASLWPKPHDPVAFDNLVYIQVDLNKATCAEPKNWDNLLDRVHHLKIYTKLRNDPQAPAVASLEEALLKAYNSKNEKFCDSILKLNKTRIEVVQDAWKGR